MSARVLERPPRRGGGAGRPAAEVLEDLAVVRARLGLGATWAELAAELGMTRSALEQVVVRARARGAVIPPPEPGLRGRARELVESKRW